MRKILKPYTLIMGGALRATCKTLAETQLKAEEIQTNYVKSGDGNKLSIKIYHEQVGEEQRLVHEE